MQSLQHDQGPAGDTRFCTRHAPRGTPPVTCPPLPGIFPDSMAPAVFTADDGERELTMMRWGVPGPPQFGKAPIFQYPEHGKTALAPLVGAGQPVPDPGHGLLRVRGHKASEDPAWFALDASRPLFAFAGIWTPWHGVRGTKANPVEGEHRLYGFLTTEANGIVGAILRRCRSYCARAIRWMCGCARLPTRKPYSCGTVYCKGCRSGQSQGRFGKLLAEGAAGAGAGATAGAEVRTGGAGGRCVICEV